MAVIFAMVMTDSTNHHDRRTGDRVILQARKTMRLNHIDLLVSDVRRSAAFYCERFGMAVVSSPSSLAIAVLSDGEGFVLVLQRAEAGVTYPKGFHVGFLVDSEQIVHELQARARRDGAEVSDVIVNGRGTLSYFTAPDGYYVEVSCQNEKLRALREPAAHAVRNAEP
jgi:catechol 2,3-dioxygenase-like lactoylglutathione lyase family enzyme